MVVHCCNVDEPAWRVSASETRYPLVPIQLVFHSPRSLRQSRTNSSRSRSGVSSLSIPCQRWRARPKMWLSLTLAEKVMLVLS